MKRNMRFTPSGAGKRQRSSLPSRVLTVFFLIQCAFIAVTASTGHAAAQGTTTWSPITPIPEGLTSGAGTFIGSDDFGNSLAVWTQPLPDDPGNRDLTRVVTSRFLPVGGWTVPTVISDPIRISNVRSLSVSGSGAAVAAWEDFPEGSSRFTILRRFLPQSGWGAPSTNLLPSNALFGAVIDAAGDVLVAWSDSSNILHATQFDAATGQWGPATTLGVGNSQRLFVSIRRARVFSFIFVYPTVALPARS